MAERLEKDYPLSHDNWVRSQSMFGETHLAQNDALRELDPDFARLCIRFVHENMYPRTTLPQKVRELCAVAALTVLDKPGQLGAHIKAAIRAGATREEALEAVIQMIVYSGVPATLNGVHVYRRAIAELAAEDPNGAAAKAPNPPPPLDSDGLTARERALKTRAVIHGKELASTTQDEFDVIDPAFGQTFLELVAGGMYSRQVVDRKTRQLLAVAACVAINALPQFEGHAKIGLRLGLTPAEIREAIFQMSVYVGFPYVLQAWDRFKTIVPQTEAPTA